MKGIMRILAIENMIETLDSSSTINTAGTRANNKYDSAEPITEMLRKSIIKTIMMTMIMMLI